MLSRKKKDKHYLAMWDMYGLECLFDVDSAMDEHNQWEKEKIVHILKDEASPPPPRGIPIQMLILRAKFNSQRRYEIYEFASTMSYNEIKKTFKTDPQVIVNWIRENGYKVYSDYVAEGKEWVIK
jgi:hypothetical protein